MHGRGMGTSGHGSRKKKKGKGHKGGKGMAGTGKRADQKKTLVLNLYGNKYFGKQGVTSRKTKRDKRKRINIRSIDTNIESFGKKEGEFWEINLQDYKILGSEKVKHKMHIKAKEASVSAAKMIKKAGGEIIFSNKKGERKDK